MPGSEHIWSNCLDIQPKPCTVQFTHALQRASPAGLKGEGPRHSLPSNQGPGMNAAALSCVPAQNTRNSTPSLATNLWEVGEKLREENAKQRFRTCSGISCWNPATPPSPYNKRWAAYNKAARQHIQGQSRITLACLLTKSKPLPFTPKEDLPAPS